MFLNNRYEFNKLRNKNRQYRANWDVTILVSLVDRNTWQTDNLI